MNKGWIKRLIWFSSLLGIMWSLQADGWITFDNRVGGAVVSRIYTQSGRTVTAPYVVQLYWQFTPWLWTAVSQPVQIDSNGLFRGGKVIIPGNYGGKTVTLKVCVWDGQSFPSYEKAADRWGNGGESAPFTATLTTANVEPAPLMTNFKSFFFYEESVQHCTLVPTEISAQLTIQEGESAPLDSVYRSCNEDLDVTSLTAYNQNPTNPIGDAPQGLRLGRVQGVSAPSLFGPYQIDGPPFIYLAKPNVYGTDYVYSELCCQLGIAHYGSTANVITILPSAARQRPTLLLSTPQAPALLGLNDHHYRIDRSSDLNTWETAGTVTGNYSTVDLSAFVTAGASAHFLRATDVTTP